MIRIDSIKRGKGAKATRHGDRERSNKGYITWEKGLTPSLTLFFQNKLSHWLIFAFREKNRQNSYL